jgi:hypothetical protein
MNRSLVLFLGVILSMKSDKTLAPAPPAHVSNSFQFMVRAPLSRAAVLFGPDGERCWAGRDWNPQCLYPRPGKDIEGAVFTVQHGPHNSVWVNTLFDPAGGHMQYVSFVRDVLVSVVEVQLTALDLSSTSIEVTYARTALNAAANDEVQSMEKTDRASGPEWRRAIEMCL